MDKLIARTTVSPNFFAGDVFPVRLHSLQISEEPLSGIIRIQGKTDDPAFRAGVESALGVQLPAPERMTEDSGIRLAWAGRNECLCFCTLDIEEGVQTDLTDKLAGVFATTTIVSDSRVTFVVAGSDAAALVAKGCSIDTHASAFAIGHVVTTRFAGLPAMLMHRSESEYVLYFDIGYTEFVVKWLVEAAEEFESSAL